MIDFSHLTVTDLLNWATRIVTGATAVRIGLHWARQGLAIWIEPGASFWSFYDKVELTMAYLAGSLAALGRKKIESTIEEPVTRAASPSEGKIK